jgi:hypothetical protein
MTSATPSAGVVPASSSTTGGHLDLTGFDLWSRTGIDSSVPALLCSSVFQIHKLWLKTPQTALFSAVLQSFIDCITGCISAGCISAGCISAGCIACITGNVASFRWCIDRSVRSIFSVFRRIFSCGLYSRSVRTVSLLLLPLLEASVVFIVQITLSNLVVLYQSSTVAVSGLTLPDTVSRFLSRKLFYFLHKILSAVLCLVLEVRILYLASSLGNSFTFFTKSSPQYSV